MFGSNRGTERKWNQVEKRNDKIIVSFIGGLVQQKKEIVKNEKDFVTVLIWMVTF